MESKPVAYSPFLSKYSPKILCESALSFVFEKIVKMH